MALLGITERKLPWLVLWFIIGIYLPRAFKMSLPMTLLFNAVSLIILYVKV